MAHLSDIQIRDPVFVPIDEVDGRLVPGSGVAI